MFNASKPDASELPSSKQLLKSTGIAAVVASAVLVFTVLPAEYGVDPTGVGSLLGLTEMGRIKMQLAEEAAADAAQDADAEAPALASAEPPPVAPAVPESQAPTPAATAPAPLAQAPAPAVSVAPSAKPAAASDEMTFTLEPDEGFEIKLVMVKGAKASFEWFTDGPGVNYDTHADGKGIKYHGYGKGTDTPHQQGELVAAFDGNHGWFWRNRNEEPVTVTLKTKGDYTDLLQFD